MREAFLYKVEWKSNYGIKISFCNVQWIGGSSHEQSASRGKSIISFLMKEYNPTYSPVKRIKPGIWWSLWIQLPILVEITEQEKNMLDCTMTMQSAKLDCMELWGNCLFCSSADILWGKERDESWNLCVKGVLKKIHQFKKKKHREG